MHENLGRSGNSSVHDPPTWARAALKVAVTPLLRLLVIRLAVPAGQPPRVSCDTCGAPAGFASATRVLLPAGRCGVCRRPGGAPAYLLEVITIGAAVTALLAAPTWPLRLAALWWVACAVPLVFIDLRVHRLPNALTYPAAAGVAVFVVAQAAASGQWDSALRAGLVAALTVAFFLLVALLIRGLGLGDVKLIGSITLLLSWWGWGAVFTALFVAFVSAGVAGAVLVGLGRISPHGHLPMGPYLVAGTLAVLAQQAAL